MEEVRIAQEGRTEQREMTSVNYGKRGDGIVLAGCAENAEYRTLTAYLDEDGVAHAIEDITAIAYKDGGDIEEGEEMDKVITETDATMLIEMPAGTQEATVKCNLNIGPVGELYFALAVIPQVMKKLDDIMENELDRKSFAKAVTEMLYKEMVEDESE